ncbi:MAG: hypothetical protein B7733_10890 [Myxococcales bacterium FL481]|nr:MAG: hypothetical protein B7733_10890 [Myxococcales bacterium FL481]
MQVRWDRALRTRAGRIADAGRFAIVTAASRRATPPDRGGGDSLDKLPVPRLPIHSDLSRLRTSLLVAAGLAPACYLSDAPEAHQAAYDGPNWPPEPADDEGGVSPTGTGDGEPEPGDPAFACDDPEDVLQLGSGEPSGFVRCSDGLIHRAEAVPVDMPTFHTSPCVDPGQDPGCLSDDDCTLDPYGMCLQRNDVSPSHDPTAYCFCDYGCRSDADCSLEGYVCAPVGVVAERGRCIPGGCVSDEDCDSQMCALTLAMPEDVCFGTPPHDGGELLCKSSEDECRTDGDCPDEPAPDADYVRCQGLARYGRFLCNSLTCQDPGRPFVVDGVCQVAPLRSGSGWTATGSSGAVQADAELAQYWLRVGQMEHASVASFARVAMWLMAVAAPADLVDRALSAGRDEVEHARLAFALARRYGAIATEPGELPIEHALDGAGLEALVVHTISEACCNETLAAVEAHEAWLGCTEPAAKAALATIAADEMRHAAFGWRIVAWALRQRPTLRDVVADAFHEALAGAVEASATAGGAEVENRRAHGVLDGQTRRQVGQLAVRHIIRPAIAAVLGEDPANATGGFRVTPRA